MATTFKKIDRNRMRKVYPTVRAIPKPGYMSNSDAVFEAVIIPFNGNDTITYTYTEKYGSIPTVIATAESDDVNVYISNVTTTSVVLNVSAPSPGNVHLQILLT